MSTKKSDRKKFRLIYLFILMEIDLKVLDENKKMTYESDDSRSGGGKLTFSNFSHRFF